tara:strand:+ start:130 stop:345 length:216 start_codon:yes stop_codon:yes gene_type:complete
MSKEPNSFALLKGAADYLSAGMGLAKPSGSTQNRCPIPSSVRNPDVIYRLDLAGAEIHGFDNDQKNGGEHE